jgi:hypothetical protein
MQNPLLSFITYTVGTITKAFLISFVITIVITAFASSRIAYFISHNGHDGTGCQEQQGEQHPLHFIIQYIYLRHIYNLILHFLKIEKLSDYLCYLSYTFIRINSFFKVHHQRYLLVIFHFIPLSLSANEMLFTTLESLVRIIFLTLVEVLWSSLSESESDNSSYSGGYMCV